MKVICFASILAAVCAAPVIFDDAIRNLIDNNDELASIADVGELGDHFEGDMLLNHAQMLAITKAIDSRNGLVPSTMRWPNRTVVYYLDEDDFDEDQISKIKNALQDISTKSCIKFRPKKNEEHAVVFESSGNGCYSNVGYQAPDGDSSGESSQVLNLSQRCFKHGIIIHEMLHTIGFFHMQSTYDRDDFVKIIWENIIAGMEHNFAKYTNDTVTNFGVPYDYSSVMHYSDTAFSTNGSRTIIPLQDGVKIGQRDGMSGADIVKLNKMYCESPEMPLSLLN